MNKKLLLAFIGICFSWSFSWIAITFQVKFPVPVEYSLFYRFFAAGLLCMAFAIFMGYKILIPKGAWKYIVVSAATNASLNFMCGYHASKFIPSGTVATIFSLSIIVNEIAFSISEKRMPSKKTIYSGLLGTIGLFLFILPTIHLSPNIQTSIKGVSFALIMPIIACFGFMAMKKCLRKYTIPLIVYISYVFILGSLLSLSIAILSGKNIAFSFNFEYLVSLAYLVVFASVIAYICLYYLVQHIGAAKANYSSLVYTVAATFISTYFEDYNWTIVNIFGFLLILFAMWNEFRRK